MIVKTKADWKRERPLLLEHLREFASVIKHRPFQNDEGVRGVSAFALHSMIIRTSSPVSFTIRSSASGTSSSTTTLRYPISHRTLEQERKDPQSSAIIEREVQNYEMFPALWDVDAVLNGGMHIKEDGMEFPIGDELNEIYNERQWHSYVTYVRLAST